MPSIQHQEAESGGSVSLRPAWTTEQALGQPRLHVRLPQKPGESLRKMLGFHVKREKRHLEQTSEELVSTDALTLDGHPQDSKKIYCCLACQICGSYQSSLRIRILCVPSLPATAARDLRE